MHLAFNLHFCDTVNTAEHFFFNVLYRFRKRHLPTMEKPLPRVPSHAAAPDLARSHPPDHISPSAPHGQPLPPLPTASSFPTRAP